METLQAFDIIEVQLEVHEEVYHALKMLEHCSIVQRSMPQCEFHPSAQHIEDHIKSRISASLGAGPLQQAKKLLVSLTRISTSYDRPMLPQVRTFVLEFLSQTVQQIPADRKTSDKDGQERDRELLSKIFLQELLISLDFRLLTLWCELLKYWRELLSLVEYKAVRELLPLLFEQASKMPVNLELATVPVKKAVNDYVDVMRYVIDRQNAFIPSLLVIDQMKRSFAAALPPLPTNVEGNVRRKSYLRESPPAYKHSSQQKFVDEYVASFEPLELILKINEHVKKILLPVLGVSPVKSWIIEPTTLRFSDRPMWTDLTIISTNKGCIQQQQVDFLVRLTMMPNSRDSIIHFITPALPDLSGEKQGQIKPETLQLMLDHCLNDVFVRAVIQTARFCAADAADDDGSMQQRDSRDSRDEAERRMSVKARLTLLWKQLSQDLLHRYQLRLIDASEVITQLVHEVTNLRPATRAAAIDSFLFLVFDYFTCTQNVKNKPPRDDVFDLLRLYTFLYSGSSDQYRISDPARFFQNASAVIRMAPASLWNHLYIASHDARAYAMAHRPPALLHHFIYLDQWRTGTLPARSGGVKLSDADNDTIKKSDQTDIEYVIATNAFSNDDETFGVLGLHFLDQLLPAGHIHIIAKASAAAQQQQQATRKGLADLSVGAAPGTAAVPAINQSSTFGTKLFDYAKPLSWSVIDMMTILSRSKLAQALKMSYMKFHSTMNQALSTAVSMPNTTNKATNLLTPHQQQQQRVAAAPPLNNPDGSPSPPLSAAAVQILLNVVWMSPGCIETYAKFLLNGVTEIHSLFLRAQKNVGQVLMPHCSPQQQNLYAYHHFQAGFLISFSPIIELYSIRNVVAATSTETIRALQSLIQFQSENHFFVAYNPAVAINTWRVIVQTLMQGFDLLDLESVILTSKPQPSLSSRITDFDFITDKNEEFAKLFVLLLAQASHITGNENHRVLHVKQQLVRLGQSSSANSSPNGAMPSLAMPWHMVMCMPEHMQRTLTDLNLFQPAPAVGAIAPPLNVLQEVDRTAVNVQSILSTAAATVTETLDVARIARLVDYFTQPSTDNSSGGVQKNYNGIMLTMPPCTLYAYLFRLLQAAVLVKNKPENVDVLWTAAFKPLGGLAGVARLVDGLRMRRRASPPPPVGGGGNPSLPPPVVTTLHYDNVRTLAQYVMALLQSPSPSVVAEAESFSPVIFRTLSMLIFNMGLFTLDTFLISMLLAPSERNGGLASLLAIHRFAVNLVNAPEYIAYLKGAIAEIKLPTPSEWLPTVVVGNNTSSEQQGEAEKFNMCEANMRLTERYPELMYFNGQVRSLRGFGASSRDVWFQSVNFVPPTTDAATTTQHKPRLEPSAVDISSKSNTACGQPVHYITPPQYFMNLVSAMVPAIELLLQSLLALLSVSLTEQQIHAENIIDSEPAEVESITNAALQLIEELLCSPAMWTISGFHPKPLTLLSNTMRYFQNAVSARSDPQSMRLAQLRRLLCRAVLLPFYCYDQNGTDFVPADVRSRALRAGFRRNIVPNFSPHFATYLLASSFVSEAEQRIPVNADSAVCDAILRDYGIAVVSDSSGTRLSIKLNGTAFSDRNVHALLAGDHNETRMYVDQMLADLNDTLYSYYTVCSSPVAATNVKDAAGGKKLADLNAVKVEDMNTDDIVLLDAGDSKPLVLDSTKNPFLNSHWRYLTEHCNACIDYRYSEITNPSKRTLLCALVELATFQLDQFVLIPTLLGLPERIETAYHNADERVVNENANESLPPLVWPVDKFGFLQQLVERRNRRNMQQQRDPNLSDDTQEIEAVNQLKLNILKLMNCIAVLLANMPAVYLDVFYDHVANVIETLSLPEHPSTRPDGAAVTCSGVNCATFELLKITSIFTTPDRASVDGKHPVSTFSTDKYRPALALHLFRNVSMHLNTSRLNGFMRLCLTNPTTSVSAGTLSTDVASGGGGNNNGRWAAKIDTEEKLIFMLHCFGPILDRFKYESHSTTHKVRYATLQLLAQVDRILATTAAAASNSDAVMHSPRRLFQHVNTISDFFCILKYLYTGDARLFDSDKLAADLHCPAMKSQLKFLVAPEQFQSSGAGAATASSSTGAVNGRSETPQAMNVDTVALPLQQQHQRSAIGLFRNIQTDSRSSTPNAMQLDVQMGK